MNNFRLWKCTIQTVSGYLAWQACIHTLCIIDLYTGSEDIGKGHGKLWLWGWGGFNAYFWYPVTQQHEFDKFELSRGGVTPTLYPSMFRTLNICWIIFSDIMLPGTATSTQSTAGTSTNKIPAGQQIFIIKTPKGVYIRTNSGKIFAVRAKFPLSGSTTAVASSSSPVTSATNSSTSSG